MLREVIPEPLGIDDPHKMALFEEPRYQNAAYITTATGYQKINPLFPVLVRPGLTD